MITVTKPGLLTSIQDLGRFGYQKYGIITSGAMDPLAHRIANLLVGNEEGIPTLEITFKGPSIHFHQDSLIAICGGDFAPTIDGVSIKTWRPLLVKKGSELKFGYCLSGCRANIAIAGGFSIPKIMGSTSTYLRAKIGGFQGRPLQAGDQIQLGGISKFSNKIMQLLQKKYNEQPFIEMGWSVSKDLIPNLNDNIRMMKGRQFHLFTTESQRNLFTCAFNVTAQSDRMGYRLEGPSLKLKTAQELLSEAVSFGTVQVPSDGNPIILLADRQTTGGYPKIGQIASVDFSLLAQAKPGDTLNFTEITHNQAQLLFLEREKKINMLKRGIYSKCIQEVKINEYN